LWWTYAAAATAWLTAAHGAVRVGWWIAASVRAAAAAAAELGRQLWRPLRRWGWRRVKTGRLYRTAGWVHAAWLVAYSSEDEQGELDMISPSDEDYLITADEDYNLTNDDDQDFDQLGVGVHAQVEVNNPWEEGWYHDLDSWWDDWTEQLEDYLFDELPHRAGLAVRPFVDFAVRLPVWGVLEGLSLAVLTAKLEYQRGWHDFLTRRGRRAAPVVVIVWAARFGAWLALFAWMVAQVDYATLRVEVTCTLEAPWREEYYLGWVVFCFLSSVYLVGPLSWKEFFFQGIGLNYLAGIFLGVTEAAAPDEYYPTRPVGPVSRWVDETTPGAPVREDFFDDHTDFDVSSGPVRVGMGYDDARVVLLREYGFDDDPYDYINDLEILGFLFPFHRGVHEANPGMYPGRPRALEHVRASRDGQGFRNDRYLLDFPPPTADSFVLPGYPAGMTPNERGRLLNREDHASD
jgi:hypothetical protein